MGLRLVPRIAGGIGKLRGVLLRPDAILWLLLACLLMLPVVGLNAISSATIRQMQLQAREVSTLASGIRAYYADNVIARLQAADGQAVYSEKYREVHGGIPIPATLSIELGALFDNAHTEGRISYEFISDYPFANRVSRTLDSFEGQALEAFRSDPGLKTVTKLEGNGLGRSSYRLATPVLMRQACVTCHNAHPDSPKRDWKTGDVRGIQAVTVRGLRVDGFGNLGYLLGYVGLLGVISVGATGVFRHQSLQLNKTNRRLVEANARESTLSARMADQLQELSIFGTVVDHSVVGIAVADMRQPDNPLVYVNQAFTVITGYSRELAIGFNCRFLQGPDTDPKELERLRQAIRSGAPYSGELINYRQDGSRFWNRLTLTPVGGSSREQPDFYVADQVDITSIKGEAGVPLRELRALEGELQTAEQALSDAARFGDALQRQMEAAGDLASLQMEAFLRSQQQALRQLTEVFERIAQLLRLPRDAG